MKESTSSCNCLSEEIGLEASEVLELMQVFRDVTLADLGRIREGLGRGDVEQVRRSAHSIKGAALNLSLLDIASAAADVEECAGAGVANRLALVLDILVERFDDFRRFIEDP